MHLRHADLLGDLCLGEVAVEAQVENPGVPLVQTTHRRHQRLEIVDRLERVLRVWQYFGEGGVPAETWLVERLPPVGTSPSTGVLDVGPGHACPAGQFLVGGAVAEFPGGLVSTFANGADEFLDPPRDPDVPGRVAEVPADLTGDRGYRERDEVAARLVEAPGGEHQTESRDLYEVVVVDAPVAIAQRERSRERQVIENEALDAVARRRRRPLP